MLEDLTNPNIKIISSTMVSGRDKILLVSEEEHCRIIKELAYRPTNEQIRSLRDTTGYGMMACKKALTISKGDKVAAIDWLIRRSSI
jgi:hypothetical protein